MTRKIHLSVIFTVSIAVLAFTASGSDGVRW